jgi:hypothetical protein
MIADFGVGFISLAVLAQAAQRSGASVPEIRDIVPPLDVFPYPMWMVVCAALAALLLAGVVIWLIKRWLRNRPPPLPISPRTIALRRLEALRTQLRSTDPHTFSVAVSDVLRTYVGAAFGLHATQQTSPEFLAAISDSREFSDADRELLSDFLERCDMIKFARVEATADDSERLLNSASAFVQGGRT